MPSPDIDEIAVERAMGGDRSVTLTDSERAVAIAKLETYGLSARQIADRLGTTERTVTRHRAKARVAC